jgi:hypothetical protein
MENLAPPTHFSFQSYILFQPFFTTSVIVKKKYLLILPKTHKKTLLNSQLHERKRTIEIVKYLKSLETTC